MRRLAQVRRRRRKVPLETNRRAGAEATKAFCRGVGRFAGF